MSRTLRDELQKTKLVAKSEEQPLRKGKSYIEKRLDSYPSNRLGKPVQWAKWLVRRKTPKNVNRRCCLCGLSVRKSRVEELKENKELTIKIKEEFERKNIDFCSTAKLCAECVSLMR